MKLYGTRKVNNNSYGITAMLSVNFTHVGPIYSCKRANSLNGFSILGHRHYLPVGQVRGSFAKMLWILLVIVVGDLACMGYGQSCPVNIQQRIMDCSQLLQGFNQALSPPEQQQQCGTARSGLECLRGVVNECHGIEGTPIGHLVHGFSQLEERLNHICPTRAAPTGLPVSATNNLDSNIINSCSRRDQRLLRKCTQRMQRYGAESPVRCSKVRRALYCMETMARRCSAIIDPEIIAGVNSLRDTIRQSCIKTNEAVDVTDENSMINDGNELPEESSCPADYVTTLQRCTGGLNRQMGTIIDGSRASLEQCQEMYRNLKCIVRTFSSCPNKPEVVSMTAAFNRGHISNYIDGFCSPSNKCDISDTEGELERCNSFLSSFQQSGGELSARCSKLYEGFDCFRNLIRRCPDDKAVAAFASMIDIEETRESMSQHCPVRK